ncbi:DUF6627 family protein [Hydrogenovibrio kuenenii]|uniref:DUF6627 family protein n=1 Tax=Hydrogenovibrio kuenenii TaxID=63658 RepID=UPI000463829C|nr:DUF6627 family protein [Hydrogenovibrio kuenenii]
MRKTIALSMILTLLASFVLPVQAAMIGTGEMLHQQSMVNERVKLAAFLDRDEVKQQLVSMGVSPDQVKSRVASMTDQEVSEINHKMEAMPAGGDVLGIVVLIFIVFVITDVIGATDIFPFIKPVR